MTDPAVESQVQIQLTFQDKSTDSSLNQQVTRESWLDEVQSQLALSPVPDAAGVLPGESLAPEESFGEMSAEVSHQTSDEFSVNEDSVLEDLSFSAEVEEMDFSNEPLPQPLQEASEKVSSKLGSLTLPAALCDEDLLAELAQIPNKMGFKIGEVAEMLGIKQYVLRYWETEFDVLKPKKAANNQRYYTKKDVENVYLIRKLLHRDRFSIEGARSAMRDLKSVVKKEKDWNSVNHKVETLQERVDHLLVDLRKLKQMFAV